MAADAVIGSSYLQVIPKMDDSDIKKELGRAEKPAGEAGDKAGTSFGSFFGKAAKVLVALGITKAVTDTVKAATSAYADYEQLIGGVETLYGDAADTLVRHAQDAYRTAGMSANQYMETSTSFAAALVSSLGGNTEEAARLADVAITDMADNANKMGTSMEAIENAYQGFAKQNYTMLDNLKLGYGGTKTEMERLLADAEAISGIHYDIENYSDVVEAIHVIQDEMGITGTTAEESAQTISGSWASLQASWDNLLVSLAGGGEEIDTSMQQVFASLETWLNNIVPVIATAAGNIFSALPTAASKVMQELSNLLVGGIRNLFGEEVAESVLDALNSIHGAFTRLTDAIRPLVEAVLPVLVEFIGILIAAVAEIVDVVITVLTDIVTGVIDFCTSIPEKFTELKEKASEIWENIKTAISDTVENIKTAITEKFEAIKTGVSDIVNGIKTAVTDKWDAIKNATTEKFDAIKTKASEVWEGVKSAIETPINKARDIVKDAIDKIKGFFEFKIEWPHISLPHFSISGSANPLDWLTEGVPHISIDWYAKGGIVDAPTIQAIGVGEAGAELIWPSYEPYLSKYADAIASRMDGGGTTNNYYIDGNLVAADAQLAAALDAVAQRIGSMRRMGVAY